MVWCGDSHYGRVEAMDWADDNDTDYVFGLPGNVALDALMAETADNLRFHHAILRQAQGQSGQAAHPCELLLPGWQLGSTAQVVARLQCSSQCSLQPDGQEGTATGMRQEVDIRYVITSLKGSAQHLYENCYCQRGQREENLIKPHSDRMSCHSAIANQVRLVFHTAAYWLMHGARATILAPPTRSPAGSSRRDETLE